MFSETASVLRACLVAVYRPFVARAIEGLRAEIDDETVERGERWLDRELATLLVLPFAEQRRSPLEVFQEAMKFVNEDLAEQGVVPPKRDAAAERALPGDLYDLAPASSQALGGGVWEAHLAWGAAKAADAIARAQSGDPAAPDSVVSGLPDADARPRIGLLGTDLMDRTKIEGIAAAAGYALTIWRRVDDIEAEVVLALIDLNHAGADDAVRRLSQAEIRVVAFGPHVDDFAMARAGSLGADEVLARSVFFKRLPKLLPMIT